MKKTIKLIHLMYAFEKLNSTDYGMLVYCYNLFLKTVNEEKIKRCKEISDTILKKVGLKWKDLALFQENIENIMVYCEKEDEEGLYLNYNDFREEQDEIYFYQLIGTGL